MPGTDLLLCLLESRLLGSRRPVARPVIIAEYCELGYHNQQHYHRLEMEEKSQTKGPWTECSIRWKVCLTKFSARSWWKSSKEIGKNLFHFSFCIIKHNRVWMIGVSKGRVCVIRGFPGGASGKKPACQCRRHRDEGLIPGSGRLPGGGLGNPL